MKRKIGYVVEYYTHSYHSQNRHLLNLKSKNIDDYDNIIKELN